MKMDHRSYVVIEDDQDVAVLLQAILGEYDAGAEVHAYGYLPPLDELADPAPRAIILDLTLGGQPVGLAYYDEIRSFMPLADVPVLICTAASSRVAAKAQRLSAAQQVGVVTKPFSLDEFVNALRDLETRAGLFGIPRATPFEEVLWSRTGTDRPS